ncbi:MAG: LysE family translocator [Chloroflexota bacterium]
MLGLSAGIAPGPLLTLVITETLRHDLRAGVKVSLAPLITDLPIVLMTLLLASRFSTAPVLGTLSFLGAAFLVYLGLEGLRFRGVELPEEATSPRSLKKGVIANLLNPHPYVFWLSIGAPTVVKAYREDLVLSIQYLLGFYVCLIGAKVLVAVVISRSKTLLKTRAYVYTNKLLGLLLLIFALLFARQGLQYFGVI